MSEMVPEGERGRESVLSKDRDQKVSALVDAARSGDGACLEELISLHHPEIFRMVYSRTGSRMDAEDLTQEIFIKMSKGLSRLRDPARFRGWLYLIAVNRVRDFHRKKRLLSFFVSQTALKEKEPVATTPNPARQIMEKEFWHRFYGLTRKMPLMEREVFTLRYLDQLGIKEIAETLKKSESTVKTHLYRALKKFRRASELRALLKGNEA